MIKRNRSFQFSSQYEKVEEKYEYKFELLVQPNYNLLTFSFRKSNDFKFGNK
jgi:hypothetical protein